MGGFIAMNARMTLCAAAALLAGGCATPPPVDPKATVAPVSALVSDGSKGTATVHAVFPCHVSDLFIPNRMISPGYDVQIDGKAAAKLMSCEYREITVPAGKHAIRLGEGFLDLGAMFGNGEEFALPAGGHAYFMVGTEYHGTVGASHYLQEVSGAQAHSAIAAIDKDTKGK